MPSLRSMIRPSKLEVIEEKLISPRIPTPHHKSVRSSFADEQEFGNIWSAGQSAESLPFDAPWEVLEYVEFLSVWNPDYSQAVDNVRNMGSTEFTFHFQAGNQRNLEVFSRKVFRKFKDIGPRHGGAVSGVVDNLIVQAATYGAMAAEWILNDTLTDVIDLVLVNPKSIRYFWNKKEGRYVPYQKVSFAAAEEAKKSGQETIGNHIRLNELTFMYAPFHNAIGGPYGVPPFLSALESVGIQKDMLKNMKAVVKKLGMLGLIDMKVTSLEQEPGEPDANYISRVESYLQSYVSIAEQLINDGALLHYDDLEVGTFSISQNAAGAATIFDTNQEELHQGLKSFPTIQSARSASTVDTLAGLTFDLMLSSARKYQAGAASILEDGIKMMDMIWGTNILTGAEVIFRQQRPINRLYDAMAFGAEIKNQNTLWINGMVDQAEASKNLGVDHPPVIDMPEPLVITAQVEDGAEQGYVNKYLERVGSQVDGLKNDPDDYTVNYGSQDE